ncbi:hypothetical protein TCAL_06789 [Tigriopus californicus]|uniref:poly(ADP-ribose) glycohydrolase n=1 Tax=Tigriopus californicus TaxID=6832 RepID=A0A553PKC8_TIGCA|nr:poly(ADP-ribose) glycohydrolase-like [Tigriopus californicus]TRY78138.1 hypothetical protein TCAL_06789 [Tigriopus californicus]|eukprot:TCALIF_06789-PA protein Name:"Similar to PARG Poly(ADP-ribose) glycohydrolase (Bos taurus)" AED:0.05 eAED:0.05 QI:0/-1/0/1/-1/1/1/0/451
MIELPSYGDQEVWMGMCQIFKDFKAISDLNHDTLIALFSATSGVDCSYKLDNLMECLLEGKDSKTASALIHGIIDAALQLDQLFPSGTLSQLDHADDHISYSRSHVRCLLAHMFWGTLKPLWNESFGLYRTSSGEPIHQKFPRTFLDWYQSKDMSEQSKIYIRTILNYFQTPIEDTHAIDFYLRHRRLEPFEWMDSKQHICPVQVRTQGRIGDYGANFEVDFANKQVGFGQGATQEELILGTSPESCVVVLISKPLEDDFIIEIKGCQMFGDYTGFGASAKFCPPMEDKSRDWSQRTILAMDAEFYDGLPGDNRLQQLKDEALFRELNKAYCAFSAASGSTIETGPWGCGAFGGDREIKLIIQVLAASRADCRELVLYTFGNVNLSEKLNELLDCIHKRQIGVGKVLGMLCHSRNDIYPSFDMLTWKQREDNELFLCDLLLKQMDKMPIMV